MSYQDFPPALLILSPRLTVAGNPNASVVGINTTEVADGSLVYCIANKSEYQLDRADNSTAADGNNVLAPLAGPGRWFKRFSPAEGPGGPLARTFYVSPNTNPFPDGSIENPFPDPATALAAIPAPVDLLDQANTWAVICTPAVYTLTAPLLIPNRAIALTSINYGTLEGISESVVIANGSGTPIKVQIPSWTAGGSQLAVFTMQGVTCGELELIPTADSAVYVLKIDQANVAGNITKTGTHSLSLVMTVTNQSTVNDVFALGASDQAEMILVDSNVGGYTGAFFADGSFIGTWNPAGVDSHADGCTIATINKPATTTQVIRLDSCELTESVATDATQGQYIFDSATLRSLISNAPSSVEGLPISVADAASCQADFVPLDGGAGDVTFTPGTLTLPNFVTMSPAVSQNLNLPDATSWQIPGAPGKGGRSLWIKNAGTGTIAVVPLGADTTSLASVASGQVALITPNGTNWDQVLVV